MSYSNCVGRICGTREPIEQELGFGYEPTTATLFRAKADQRMDFSSYGLTLGNMNRTKINERIWMGKISLVLMFPRLTEEDDIQLYNTSPSNFFLSLLYHSSRSLLMGYSFPFIAIYP